MRIGVLSKQANGTPRPVHQAATSTSPRHNLKFASQTISTSAFENTFQQRA
ncbi:hypothetical protein PtA15_5A746 [Puccinia triticina]|uniref:Uncharacterized protein n=1 Tax=Puccinia triticina TaxID=208348 RepID=A0ABY7CMH2_9BASI|nr:uncharacterized protein PtA15_5A746 [Puccinia triticina]WAQ85172.1 hypothetical protein PtA15_5A746 [Puccinia triticina]WAR58510.1 hypothetical protein PtB15_5B744 [Puccinia triticina]